MPYHVFGDDVVGLFTALSLHMRLPRSDIENEREASVKLYGGQGTRLKEPDMLALSKANRGHIGKLLRHYWRAETKPHIPHNIARTELETLLRLLWRVAGQTIEALPTELPRPVKGTRNILTPAALPTLLQKQVSNQAIHRSTYHAFSYFVPNQPTAEAAYYASKQPDSPLENVTAQENKKTGQTQVSLHYPSTKIIDERQKTTLNSILDGKNLNQSRWLTGEALRRARLGPYIVLSADHERMNQQLCSLESYSVARIYDEVANRYIAGIDILGLTPELNPNQAFNAARLYFRPKRSNFHLAFSELAAPPSRLHNFRADVRFAATLAFAVSGIAWLGSLGGIMLVLAAAQLFHLTMIPVPFTIAVLLAALAFTLSSIYLLASGKAEIWHDELLGLNDDLELVRLHEFAGVESKEAAPAPTSELQNPDTYSEQIENILQGWSQAAKAKKPSFWQTADAAKAPVLHTITLLGLPS